MRNFSEIFVTLLIDTFPYKVESTQKAHDTYRQYLESLEQKNDAAYFALDDILTENGEDLLSRAWAHTSLRRPYRSHDTED